MPPEPDTTGDQRPRGRRPGPTTTPHEVLEAARRCFAESGYDRTTVRAIAREAGVDPALVIRQFGSKEQLYVAVVTQLTVLLDAAMPPEAGREESLGTWVATAYFGAWAQPQTRLTILAVLRSIGANDTAAQVMWGFVRERLLPRLLAELPGARTEDFVPPMAAQLVGMMVTRHLLALPPIVERSDAEIIELTAAALDGIFERAVARGAARATEAELDAEAGIEAEAGALPDQR